MRTLHEITVAVGGGLQLDRAGLTALIAGLPGLKVVPKDNNPPPQILVWVYCSGELPSISPKTVVLLLTEHVQDELLPEAVFGLFSRDETAAALGLAIRQVASGEQYLSPSLAAAMLQKRQSEFIRPTPVPELTMIKELTEREREILDLLVQGLSNKLIASKLYLSVRTVEGHLANIYLRLGVHSRTEAMLMAMRIPKSAGTIVR